MTNYSLNGDALPHCFAPSLLPSIENYYRPLLANAKGNKPLILCPLHAEKTASFSIDLATGRFYCFGCGVSGGDIVDFHKLKNGFTFLQAITDLGATVRKNETPQELAARQQRINAHEKNRQQQRQLAEQQAQTDAQAFIVMIESVVKHHATPPMLTPYCEAKSIQPHNLLALEASTLHRIKHPLDSYKTLGYGLTGLLTVALLHTLEGQLVALQVFDGVPDDKGKFARRYIGRPFYLGGYYTVGNWTTPLIILLVEGVADAITAFEATGYPSLAAGSKNQLLAAALAIRKKYPHALMVIVADNDLDGSGERAANDAAQAVNGVVIIPPQGCKDSNDLAKTHGLQAVKQMIDDAIAIKKAVPPSKDGTALNDEVIPPSIEQDLTHKKQSFAYGGGFFEVSPKGVFYIDEDNKPHFICSPLWVKAKTRTGQGEAWGRLLEWLDDDGNLHQWAMPLELLEGDCAEVRRELAHKGVSIEPSKRGRDRLAIYLKKAPVEDRALCVERLGWYGDVYILPKQVIGTSKEIVVFQNPHGIETAFSQSGTVEQWRDNVACFATGNTRLLFALSFSFGSPLFELSNAESGGIHFLGASSIGKSTFLDAACSTWGKPQNYKREWRNTANAIEGLCALHNNGLLVLDEINQADSKTIGQTIYMIVNGQSKGRMTKSLMVRPVSRWNTAFLSGGEKTLETLLKEAGQPINAGQAVRLANVRALVGRHGAFEQLHGIESGDTLSKLIKSNANKYYGTVGITWLKYVTANKASVTRELDRGIKAWLKDNVPQGASGQVSRVASRFALIAIAGELATQQGLTGWPLGAADDAAKICFNDWLLSFGGISNHEDRAILAHVRAFFEAHGSSRFESLEQMGDKVEKVPNRVGYWKQDNTGKYYLVFNESFKNEICKGFDPKLVIRVLSDAGVLIKDKEGYSTTPTRTPESEKTTRMYVINTNMLFSTCNSRNTCNNDDSKQDFTVTGNESEPVTPVTESEATTSESIVTESCYRSHRSKDDTCNKKNNNKINNVTGCTGVTAKKQDIVELSEDVEVF